MEIKLEIKDSKNIATEKTFVTDKIMSRLVRMALEIKALIAIGDPTPEMLDTLIDFTCLTFNNKFTRDELYDGLEANLLFPTLIGVVEGVINGVTNKLTTFPEVK